MAKFTTLFVLFAGVIRINSLKILLYQPSFGHSHVNFVGKIADVLADAGHQVVLLQPQMNPKLGAGTDKAEVIQVHPNPETTRTLKLVSEGMKVRWDTPTFYFISMARMMRTFRQSNYEICEEVMHNHTLIEHLKSYDFDYAMSQPFDFCGFGIFHLLGIDKFTVILSTTMSNSFLSAIGAPVALSYVPGMSVASSDQMGFWERARNTVSYFFEQLAIKMIIGHVDDLIRQFDPTYPGGAEQFVRACFIMPNSEPLFEFPAPTIYKVVPIGGISVPPPSTTRITEEFNQILNIRPHTVLVSFGSLSKSVDMPQEYKIGLVETMKKFPDVTFLWKYEDPTDEAVKRGAKNIVLNKWVPQTDLLSDKRLTGFITHGGAGSTNELILRGKKAIVIPIFGDQQHNAKLIEKQGIGIRMEKDDLKDSDKMTKAIKRLLFDPKIQKAAVYLGKMIAERPLTPQEQLVRYTEFAARYGPFPQLDPYGRQLSFLTYYLLDVIFLVIGVFFMGSFTIAYLCSRIRSHRKTKVD